MANTRPVFQKIGGSALFDVDEWTVEDNSKVEKPKEYLEFNTPPLALVLAMQEAGKESYEIYETLKGVGKMHGRIDIVPVITTEHQKLAAEIYDYFAKKHTMRRIKGEWISDYMLAVDDLCENRKKIDEEHVKILVSLPRIYNQNRNLENVMKGRCSAPKQDNLDFPAWEGIVEFVNKVNVKSGQYNEMHYFFSMPKNHLMRVVVKKNEYGANAWDCLSRFGKLKIKTNATWTFAIKGYDFNVVQPSPSEMEIEPV